MRTNGILKDAGFLIGPSQVLCVDVLLLIPAFGSRVVTTIQCVRVEKCRVHRLWGLSGLSLRVCACVLSCCGHVQLFVILWITACQASLSMGFSRKNTGVGCHTHGLSKPSKEERLKFRV